MRYSPNIFLNPHSSLQQDSFAQLGFDDDKAQAQLVAPPHFVASNIRSASMLPIAAITSNPLGVSRLVTGLS